MENKYYSSQKNDVLFHIFNKNKVCIGGSREITFTVPLTLVNLLEHKYIFKNKEPLSDLHHKEQVSFLASHQCLAREGENYQIFYYKYRNSIFKIWKTNLKGLIFKESEFNSFQTLNVFVKC